MENSPDNLSPDELIAQLQAELHQTKTALQATELRLAEKIANEAYLKAQIADLKRKLFGQSRERFTADVQQHLPFEAPPSAEVVQEAKLAKQRSRKSNILSEPNYLVIYP